MNKNIIYNVLCTMVGAAIGGVICWKLAEKKYTAMADEEIASVKERYTIPKVEITPKMKSEKNPGVENLANNAINKPSLTEYVKKIKDSSYTNYSGKEEKDERKSGRYPWEKDGKDLPYVISPDEYGDNEEYTQVSLTFYADGILADEDDVILDADEVVGNALDHIGDYEDDAVHVCNPGRKAYYEILAEERSYKEATNKDPHLGKDEED